jgi:hypothetical protein
VNICELIDGDLARNIGLIAMRPEYSKRMSSTNFKWFVGTTLRAPL